MERVKPRTLSGFMELLPPDQMKMERFMQVLRDTYALYGFTPLDTPVVEAAEVLLAKGGGDTEKQIYRIKKGDTDLALRFDLTVPLAKYVALNYAKLTFPFRRYQIGKVYRGERTQRGRFREFYQADIDVIGDGQLSVMNEAEIPAVIYRTFTALGLKRFRIRVNNRKVLGGFLALCGLEDRAAAVMRAVDRLDKAGKDAVFQMLIDEGIPEAAASKVMDFIAFSGTNAEKLAFLRTYLGQNPRFDQGLRELEAVAGHLSGFGVPEEHFEIDLTIARGLDYYTGTVYETLITDHPEIGSVCSGGRYDDLAEYYTDKKLPGVGISIGLTRLFYVLSEQGLLSDELVTAPADALVIPQTDDFGPAVSCATVLREAGIRTQVYYEEKKFKARMSYADKLGVPFVLILGEDEIAKGTVALKDMKTAQQMTCTPGEAARQIAQALEARRDFKLIKG